MSGCPSGDRRGAALATFRLCGAGALSWARLSCLVEVSLQPVVVAVVVALCVLAVGGLGRKRVPSGP